MNSCYLLVNQTRTYNGYTTQLKRRLRQHNGELRGGARATTRFGPGWTPIAVVTSRNPEWTKERALSLEWHIRYPTGKRPRPKQLNGPDGRIQGLILALGHGKFAEFSWTVYVDLRYRTLFEHLENVEAIYAVAEHPDLDPATNQQSCLVGRREHPPETEVTPGTMAPYTEDSS